MTEKYDDMYEYLSGFTGKSFEDIYTYLDGLEQAEFDSFLDNLASLIPEDYFENDGIFNYSVDSTLEGGPFPCGSFPCRINNIENLARFSALYADKTLIQCPIDHAFTGCHADFVDLEELAFGIYVTVRLERLVKAGYMGFRPSYISLCNGCLQKQLSIESAASQFLNGAWDKIVGGFHESATCTLHAYDDGSLYVEIAGMNDYGSHEILDVSFRKDPLSLVELYQTKGSVTLSSDYLSSGGLDGLLIPMLSDSFHALTSPLLQGGAYLTTRPAQVKILESAKSFILKDSMTSTRYNRINLSLPFTQDASLDSIIRVRQSNEEAFQVFRDAIRASQTELASGDDVIAAVKREVIDPEIHKLELALRSSKFKFRTIVGAEAAVGAASLAVGSYFGLPIESIASIAGAIGVGSILSHGVDTIWDDSVRNNPMYFLWKITR